MIEVAVFFAQFLQIMLVCVQTANIQHSNQNAAFITSIAIGMVGMFNGSIIGSIFYMERPIVPLATAYCLGSALGAYFSIPFSRLVFKKR